MRLVTWQRVVLPDVWWSAGHSGGDSGGCLGSALFSGFCHCAQLASGGVKQGQAPALQSDSAARQQQWRVPLQHCTLALSARHLHVRPSPFPPPCLPTSPYEANCCCCSCSAVCDKQLELHRPASCVFPECNNQLNLTWGLAGAVDETHQRWPSTRA